MGASQSSYPAVKLLCISSPLSAAVHTIPEIAHIRDIKKFWKVDLPFRSACQAHVPGGGSSIMSRVRESVLQSGVSVEDLDSS